MMWTGGFNFRGAEERLLHCTPGIGDTNHNSKSCAEGIDRESAPCANEYLQFGHKSTEARQTNGSHACDDEGDGCKRNEFVKIQLLQRVQIAGVGSVVDHPSDDGK